MKMSEADRKRSKTLPKDDPRHGKASTYINWTCRCRPCTDAHAQAHREHRRRRVAEATGEVAPSMDPRSIYQRAVTELRLRHFDEFESIREDIASGVIR